MLLGVQLVVGAGLGDVNANNHMEVPPFFEGVAETNSTAVLVL